MVNIFNTFLKCFFKHISLLSLFSMVRVCFLCVAITIAWTSNINLARGEFTTIPPISSPVDEWIFSSTSIVALKQSEVVTPSNTLSAFTNSKYGDLDADNSVLRRIDLIFFVALPFVILYNNLTPTIVNTAYAGLLIGKGRSVSSTGLTVDNRILDLQTPHLYFVWTNSILWPISITLNYIVEKVNKNTGIQKKMQQTKYMSHFYHNSFQ